MRWSAPLALAFAAAACTVPSTPSAPDEPAAATTEVAVTTAPPSSACTGAPLCSTITRPAARGCSFLVVFDGSGVYSPDVGSNVGVLYATARGPAATSGREGLWSEVVDATTTRAYVEGVPGLPFGASAERVDRGRSAICQHLAARPDAGCDLVLIGYSRGAFIANQVAHALDRHGCADGSHKGQRIAFLGAFDPVSTQMGNEWDDERTGATHHWPADVPPNVENVLQVYKEPRSDPRGGFEGLTLTTALLGTAAVGSSCRAPMTASQHPESRPWHHGEIGHGALPLETMKCALETAGLHLF